jgi:hypothetical protein
MNRRVVVVVVAVVVVVVVAVAGHRTRRLSPRRIPQKPNKQSIPQSAGTDANALELFHNVLQREVEFSTNVVILPPHERTVCIDEKDALEVVCFFARARS